MGRDIAAVLEAVALDRRVVIVGHSMGAIATLAMAEVRPDVLATSVAGIVLVGTSASELVRGAMGSITDLVWPRLGSLRTAAKGVDRLRKAVLASPTDLRGAVVRLTQFGPDAPPHVVEHVVHLAERASSEVWTDGLAGLLETDLRHVLPRIRQPALVVVGEHDRVTPSASGLELAAALPDGRFVLLEHAGHIAMMERPVELDREIRAFSAAVLTSTHPPRPRRRAATKRRGDDVSRTLAEVAAEAADCTRCRLAQGRTQVVFGVGDAHAELMFIGEGPGFHEDKQGEPFVGAAGQLLNRMLGEIGLTREQVYIGNVVKCRPPGNRDPQADEIEACTPWLVEQLSLIQPRVIVTLGNFATKFVLQTETGITRLRGQVHDWHGRTVIPTFHPAAILHGGGEKSRQFQLLLDDFRLVRRTLDAPTHPVDDAGPEVAGVAGPEPVEIGTAPGLISLPDAAPVVAETDPDQMELF